MIGTIIIALIGYGFTLLLMVAGAVLCVTSCKEFDQRQATLGLESFVFALIAAVVTRWLAGV